MHCKVVTLSLGYNSTPFVNRANGTENNHTSDSNNQKQCHPLFWWQRIDKKEREREKKKTCHTLIKWMWTEAS